MGGPRRDTGERSLILRTDGRRGVRVVSALIGILAIAALWREASVARASLLAEADARAARIAAGYLSVVASPDRPSFATPEARLLSAAGALADAAYWPGSLQVWLRGVPLLPVDTTGQRAAVTPLPTADTTLEAVVAVWGTVPANSGIPGLAIGAGLAILALLAAVMAGAQLRAERQRAVVALVGLLVVGVGALEQFHAVRSVQRAVTDAGLLGVRRSLEMATIGRRLGDQEVTAIAGGVSVAAVPGELALRDPGVVRDTLGAHLLAVASLGQQWRVELSEAEPAMIRVWRALLGWGVVALLAGFIGAAVPPTGSYLSRSGPSSPQTP